MITLLIFFKAFTSIISSSPQKILMQCYYITLEFFCQDKKRGTSDVIIGGAILKLFMRIKLICSFFSLMKTFK